MRLNRWSGRLRPCLRASPEATVQPRVASVTGVAAAGGAWRAGRGVCPRDACRLPHDGLRRRRARAAPGTSSSSRWLVEADRGRDRRAERDGAGHRRAPTARPSSRTVLCKGIDARGVVFYTNYTSAKSHDLRAIRVRLGDVPLVRAAAAGARARRSSSWSARRRPGRTGRAGRAARSWARGRRRSRRSSRAGGRSTTRSRRPRRRFADDEEVPVPPHWGGWRIVPEQVEFWQGRRRPDARPAALRARRGRPDVAGAPAGAVTAELARPSAPTPVVLHGGTSVQACRDRCRSIANRARRKCRSLQLGGMPFVGTGPALVLLEG